MSREDRRISNIKQNAINEIGHYPSGKSVPEGDIIFSNPKGKQLTLYKKSKGALWKVALSMDGNQYVEKDLEVKGSANIKNNLTIKDNLGVNELDMDAPIHVTASDNTAAIIIEENHSTGGGELIFRSSDVLTNASTGPDGDFLGGVLWAGWDGDSFEYGAQVRARPEATWSGSSRSTGLEFMTTPTSSTTLTTVMTLDNAGNVFIEADKAYSARYNTTDNNRCNLQWQGLQLGNNGANYIVGGNTATGGYLVFAVNADTDCASVPSSHNGTEALTIAASGAATFSSTVQADNFKSSDGSAGITATHDFDDDAGTTHTVVVKDGLITSWTEVSG